jgi:hypothetical protein
MVPIWLAVIPLAIFIAAGAMLDCLLALDLGWSASGGDSASADAGKWARWAMCGLVACFALALHPAVFVALVALAGLGRFAKRGRPLAVRRRQPESRRASIAFGVAAAVLALVVICRPPALVYWDSFVWLAKGRIEAAGWGALRAASLDRAADVIPSGYPMLWPLASCWLSMGGRTIEALAAGAAAMTLVTLMLFLDAVANTVDDARSPADGRGSRPRWTTLALGLVAFTPLVFVHLRSAYADLPVGLLAATCTLRLSRCIEKPGERSEDLAVAAMAAVALAGLKDEGMGHVAALAIAVIVLQLKSRERLPLAPAMVVMAAAAIPFNGWRMILHAHGVMDSDHRPSAPDLASAGAITRSILQHLSDTRSWGALWPIAIACAVLVLGRSGPFRPASRFAALAFLAEGGVLFAALLFGPDRVRVFAFEGTLINRLLIQLAPPAGVLLTLALGDAAASRSGVRRSLPVPMGLSGPPAPQVVLTRSPE